MLQTISTQRPSASSLRAVHPPCLRCLLWNATAAAATGFYYDSTQVTAATLIYDYSCCSAVPDHQLLLLLTLLSTRFYCSSRIQLLLLRCSRLLPLQCLLPAELSLGAFYCESSELSFSLSHQRLHNIHTYSPTRFYR